MSSQKKNDFRDIMSGSRRGLSAGAMRLALSSVEPFYSSAIIARNKLYDSAILRATRLKCPVISVGNLTVGGTGKTPMIRWLAEKLRQRGRTVAVLSRGYKSAPGSLGDEQRMLDRMLNGPGQKPIIIMANPNRALAAEAALRQHPSIDLFLLDDGFQHRRIARDLDIVLLSATDPFGYGHVLPRGLLREPICGLTRAGAVVITHADRADEPSLATTEQLVRRWNPTAPIYRAAHVQTGIRTQSGSAANAPDRSIDDLGKQRFFAFCGLGDPQLFHRQLQSLGDCYVGHQWFADHHVYRSADLDAIRSAAREKRADILLTTEKDWVKVAKLQNVAISSPEIWRIDVELTLFNSGADGLLKHVLHAIDR